MRVGYEVFGPGSEARRSCCSPRGRSCTSRQWKLQVPVPRPALPGDHRRGPGQRAGGPAAEPERPTPTASIVADAVAVMDAAGVDRAVLVGLSMGGAARAAARGVVPGAGGRGGGDRQRRCPGRCRRTSTRRETALRGLGEGATAHYWLRRLPRLGRVLHVARSSPSRTRPSSGRTGSAGAWRPTRRRCCAHRAGLGEADRRPTPRTVCRAVRCPVLVVHGERRRGRARTRRRSRWPSWTGGELVTVPGGGHAPPMRDPVRCNLLIRGVRRVAGGPATPEPRALDPRPRPAPPGAVRLLADRARARPARPRDRRRAARACTRTWRSTGSPSTRSPGCSRSAASGCTRRRPAAGQRESAHIESRGGRARPARLPGDPADGRDPRRQLHGLPRPRRRRAATTSWSPTRAGTSTTSCTRTPSSSAAPFAWLTDFVGWLPMPDGGAAEAALTADYNAEMVEQIARYPRLRDRSVFVGNPDDLVDGPARARAADRARTGRASTSRSRATSPASPPAADRDGSAPSWATGPTSGCAWSRSAARASAARCCAGSPTALPARRRSRSPGLRMVVVTGPRIDPASVPAPPGVEVRGYVPEPAPRSWPPATSRWCRAG